MFMSTGHWLLEFFLLLFTVAENRRVLTGRREIEVL